MLLFKVTIAEMSHLNMFGLTASMNQKVDGSFSNPSTFQNPLNLTG